MGISVGLELSFPPGSPLYCWNCSIITPVEDKSDWFVCNLRWEIDLPFLLVGVSMCIKNAKPPGVVCIFALLVMLWIQRSVRFLASVKSVWKIRRRRRDVKPGSLWEANPAAVFAHSLDFSILLFGGMVNIQFTHLRLSLEYLLRSRQIEKRRRS